ncbi:HHL233Cp [Eremothecium sinecaudum]|uniref:MAP kinase kinase kinase n=1 Tax=Eremothecium sinecaudum TaxID=45286 RepID=A0A0X8HVZ8_9SACH|nr:HHL233Cp [Eremothecium sinecaudum]AMD22537.1 HHL233Cp [Eremothecium sinecaudum]
MVGESQLSSNMSDKTEENIERAEVDEKTSGFEVLRRQNTSSGRLSPKSQVDMRATIFHDPQGIIRTPSGRASQNCSSLGPSKGKQESPQPVTTTPPSVGSSSTVTRKASMSGVSALPALKSVTHVLKSRSNSSSSNLRSSPESEHGNTPLMAVPPALVRSNSGMVFTGSNQSLVSTNTATGSGNVIVGNVAEGSVASNNSAQSTLRSAHKPVRRQYVFNEKLYLAMMKKSHVDDYYTRGIAPTLNDDEEDDTDFDTPDDNFDAEDVTFNTDLFAGKIDKIMEPYDDELVSMSTTQLIMKMNWLRKSDPDNPDIETPIEYLEMNAGHRDTRTSFQSQLETKLEAQTMLNKLSKNPLVQERLEWQTMLSNVLRGDIMRSEKTKLAKQRTTDELTTQYSDGIWLELKAWLYGRTVEEQKNWLRYLCASTDNLFTRIMNFRLADGIEIDDAVAQVESLLAEYYKVVPYWQTLQHMNKEKPITNSPAFKLHIEAMNTYVVIYKAFKTEVEALAQWIGNNDLDVKAACDTTEIDGLCDNKRSFAEQILKEKDIENIFQKKIFYRHSPWIFKAKLASLQYKEVSSEINLPSLDAYLITLLSFPLKLIKEITIIRLDYAQKLEKPTMMMIDQMIDDFKVYTKLAVQIKYTIQLYGRDQEFNTADVIDSSFDATVNEAIKYFFKLLNLKLVDSSKTSFKTFKEPEVLFSHWEDLKNVGCFIDGANEFVSMGFVHLTLRLLNKLHSYILNEQKFVDQVQNKEQCEKLIVASLEHIGTFERKINRFSNVLTKALQNEVTYRINNTQMLFQQLKETGHFLIYTGRYLEDNGIYLFGSRELLGQSPEKIIRILKGSDVGSDLIPKVTIKNSLNVYTACEQGFSSNPIFVQEHRPDGVSLYHVHSEAMKKNSSKFRHKQPNSVQYPYSSDDEEGELSALGLKLKSLGYLLAVCPGETILWDGEMYNLASENELKIIDFNMDIASNTVTLLNQGSTYSIDYQCDRFAHFVGNSVSVLERFCSITQAEKVLKKIRKAYFRITYRTLTNQIRIINSIKSRFQGFESLNSIFIFCRDFARNYLRSNIAPYEKRSVIIMLMLKLSIGWLTFLVDDCDPSDSKTYKWCVPAMEFAMQMTSGWNILGIDEEQFKNLKDKISGCMSLLISHFDILGVRSWEAEKTAVLQFRSNIDVEVDNEEEVCAINSKIRLKAIEELENATINTRRQVGKVLDATDKENKYLLSLASSLSNFSIRWQKRRFIGGGSFGSVYSVVNLDTGDILAVKEIKFTDRKTMKQVFPSIKDEMTVLEMLNHPNVVQYYGVEVHRDRVNIFMEYCEGGSLASLLEHGRIEDEMVTQVYTLQLLEGLAYLHESGVDHHDIKPENILLDFNGIIKYVDFGAAKLIANNGSQIIGDREHNENVQKQIGTPMYMSPEAISCSGHGKFGSGDIWSLGCVVLEMATGRRPWANLDNQWAIMYHVAAGRIPAFPNKNEMSPAGIAFLSRCLIQDPNKRSSAVELLMDPWIIEIRNIAFGDDAQELSEERAVKTE